MIVTKPGYGIISECIAASRPILTRRAGTSAVRRPRARMPRYVRCAYIDQPLLLEGTWARSIETLMGQPAPPETLAMNGAEAAAAELSSLLDASR